jgi:hypothetical protein
MDGELDRGDDAEVAAAPAQGPEEIGVVLRVGAHQLAVGGDELQRRDGVGLQAVLARQPAHAAAERVAGDADVRRRAVERGEAMGREPRRDALPLDARADPDGHRRRIHDDLLERADVEQDGVLEAAERPLVVTRRLRGDAQPGGSRVGDRRDDVLGVGREGHRRGMLVEEEVEGGAGRIPAGIAGQDDGAGQRLGQLSVSGRDHGPGWSGSGPPASIPRRRGDRGAPPPSFQGDERGAGREGRPTHRRRCG